MSCLARLGDREIVLPDELTTGLDPGVRRDTWMLVRRLREDGVTVVLVTQRPTGVTDEPSEG